MGRTFSLICLLCLFACPFSAVRAQEEDGQVEDDQAPQDAAPQATGDADDEADDDEEEDAEPTPHPKVSIASIFPLTGPRFPAGERVELLFGFKNGADADLNVTTISASLVVPQDYRYHVENYTGHSYNIVVAPGETQTLEYAFMPDERFDPREFGFVAEIEYNDALGNLYRSVIYNGTIDIVEPSDFTDSATFFTYVAVVLGLVLAAFIVYRVTMGSKKGKGTRRAAPVETGTTKTMTSHEMEYLEGIVPSPGKEKRKKSSGKPSASAKASSGKKKSQ